MKLKKSNFIYNYLLIITMIAQSSLNNRHVPDKIHFDGSESSLYMFMFALKINVAPLNVV